MSQQHLCTAFGGNVERHFLVTSCGDFSAGSGTLWCLFAIWSVLKKKQWNTTYTSQKHENLSGNGCKNCCDQNDVKFYSSASVSVQIRQDAVSDNWVQWLDCRTFHGFLLQFWLWEACERIRSHTGSCLHMQWLVCVSFRVVDSTDVCWTCFLCQVPFTKQTWLWDHFILLFSWSCWTYVCINIAEHLPSHVSICLNS